MFQSIEKLRARPQNEKRKIALFLTVLSFVAVVFVWISLLNIIGAAKIGVESGDGALSPFSTIKKSATSIFDNAKEEVDVLKAQFDTGEIE